MNIKVGQWVRIGETIFQWKHDLWDITNGKVANTPQELVQCEDLILTKKENTLEVDAITYYQNEILYYETIIETDIDIHVIKTYPNEIITIYTPNKDKTQYTLQWRKQ